MIYFIQAKSTKLIKIGYTNRPVGIRFSAIQSGSSEELDLLGTRPGDLRDEDALHVQFRDDHVRGEWFRPSLKLLMLAISKTRPYRYGSILRRMA